MMIISTIGLKWQYTDQNEQGFRGYRAVQMGGELWLSCAVLYRESGFSTEKAPSIVRRIIMFGMQQFGGLEQGMFDQQEVMSEFCSHREDQQDRSTNQYSPDGSRCANGLEVSPCSGSYFFAPNSPHSHLPDLHDPARRRPHQTLAPAFPPAFISRKLNLEDDLNELEEQLNFSTPFPTATLPKRPPNRSARNAGGLRNLSQSVYKIVSQLNETKYKEVADRLVAEIAADAERQGSKDEHNIKRRVYDALNVLIAAGLLRKEGKSVACNEPYLPTRRPHQMMRNPQQLREKQKLEGDLRKKVEAVREKQQKLQKLEEKRNQIESLITRNKHHQLPEVYLPFPLIAVPNSPLAVQNHCHRVVMQFDGQPLLLGDLDLLMHMKSDGLQMDSLIDNYCCEEQRD